jgi:hypothetical protein
MRFAATQQAMARGGVAQNSFFLKLLFCEG